MTERKKAFSLVELIMVVMFLGILMAVTVPRLNFSAVLKQKAEGGAGKIVTALRRTRSLAICNAADNSSGFELKLTGSSPYSGYQIINLATLAVVDTHTIDSDISCTGGAKFDFGILGNLLDGSGSQLTVSAEGKTLTITIVSATGIVKCVEN